MRKLKPLKKRAAIGNQVFETDIKSVGIVLYSSLSSLSLYPLCSLRFNHSDTTGMDMTPNAVRSI
ncbi:hypothetical protein [Phormidium nigroviride]|uniref:hypothetical protein n=1 Tax=Phormidium nigroviride TaxID=482564 RepID=UPI00167F777A|nr:hypothetical protein [Oscillatoria nigro-viridis]